MITIRISNKLKVTGLPVPYANVIKKTLSLDNLQHATMLRMKKSVYGIPRKVEYFSDDGNALLLPRGVLDRLLKMLVQGDQPFTLHYDVIKTKHKLKVLKEIELRDYQVDLVDKAVEAGSGVLVSSTGSGKTVMAWEIARRIGKNTTILVPKTNLLKQFVDEFKVYFDEKVGSFKWQKPVTVTTMQSLYYNEEVRQQLVDNTAVLIVDECQGAVSTKNREVIESFRAEHIYGLTATPERTDKQCAAIHFYFGGTVAEHQAVMLTPTVEVMKTKVEIPIRPVYSDMISEMVQHEERNKLIAGIIIGEIMTGHRVLLLTKRIEHYELIREMLPESWSGLHFLSSKDKQKDQKLANFKAGDPFNLIAGTTALLSVGTDIPALDTLIIACDMKSPVLLTQSSGRILRLFEGKKNPRIIDLCDNLNKSLRYQFFARKKLYKQKKWPIVELN